MANFAVIDGINVVNTIVCESKEVAEQVTGKTCIEYSDNDRAETGGTFENNKFISKKPYPSWVLDQDDNWQSPTPYPTDLSNGKLYTWDENSMSWVEITTPVQ